MADNKKELENSSAKPKARQIIIETDGNNINIVKAEVSGNLEFAAILSSILNRLNIK